MRNNSSAFPAETTETRWELSLSGSGRNKRSTGRGGRAKVGFASRVKGWGTPGKGPLFLPIQLPPVSAGRALFTRYLADEIDRVRRREDATGVKRTVRRSRTRFNPSGPQSPPLFFLRSHPHPRRATRSQRDGTFVPSRAVTPPPAWPRESRVVN